MLKQAKEEQPSVTDDDDLENKDAEMIAEAKLLRQHKGRLEARMHILEDHNRQLELQLQRLRQLLEQVGLLFASVQTMCARGVTPIISGYPC